jgi:site-specific recombinase XerD
MEGQAKRIGPRYEAVGAILRMTPIRGAHALRHTAATKILRHGISLEQFGLVLPHRGVDTTAYYAKADVNLLKQITQPWSEAPSC